MFLLVSSWFLSLAHVIKELKAVDQDKLEVIKKKAQERVEMKPTNTNRVGMQGYERSQCNFRYDFYQAQCR